MAESGKPLEALFARSQDFNDLDFRLLLEQLLKRGGKEIEDGIALSLVNGSLSLRIRMNLIRVTGYVQRSLFLVNLKRVLENENNPSLVKESILAVSKYNDRRALNILSSALSRIKDPSLEGIIRTEMARIKDNNPLLALMPRFLEGKAKMKNFRTTVEILKKVLSPADCRTFLPFLKGQEPTLAYGAFEVLCYRGDEGHFPSLRAFYQEKAGLFIEGHREETELFYVASGAWENYVERFHKIASEILSENIDLFQRIEETRIREHLLGIIAAEEKGVLFLGQVYKEREELRAVCREKLSSSEEGAEILLASYGEDPKPETTAALLKSEKGRNHFLSLWNELPLEEKERLLSLLREESYEDFRERVYEALVAPNVNLQKQALQTVLSFRDLGAEATLLDPAKRGCFGTLEREYINLVSELFPSRLINLAVEEAGQSGEFSASRFRLIWEKIALFGQWEPLLRWENRDSFLTLTEKVAKLGAPDIGVPFIQAYSRLKTISPATFAILQKGWTTFLSLRKEEISDEERAEVPKAEENLEALGRLLNPLEEPVKSALYILQKETLDPAALRAFWETNPLAFALLRERICERVKNALLSTDAPEQTLAVLGVLGLSPLFSSYFAKEIEELSRSEKYLVKSEAERLLSRMSKERLILVETEDPKLKWTVEAQIRELLPDFKIISNLNQGEPAQVLADHENLRRESALQGGPWGVTAFLKDPTEHGELQGEGSVRAFLPPYSMAKIFYPLFKDLFPWRRS